MFSLIFTVGTSASDDGTAEISNQYIKVTVSEKNGGYVISTVEGDILKKSDDNAALTHRGENFDTSFTSFKIGSDEYVFGNKYGFLGMGASTVETEVNEAEGSIISTWSVGDFTVSQKISLVNNYASEQLGTAMITYRVKNGSDTAKNVEGRILIDTQLGEKDYGYYEVPNQKLGQGYTYFEREKTWDTKKDPTVLMPADYFVKDNPYSASVIGFGVNSVFTEQKPYKMTFAHWANIASTVFDYEPDETLNFTNDINGKKTADSAAALYYDLGTIEPGKEKSFSTYYGVTANVKNKDNKIILNTTAPSKLEFKDGAKSAYSGSGGVDNVARINVNLNNPYYAKKHYKDLAVVVYAMGFETERQTDAGNWIKFTNDDPIFSEIKDFAPGESKVTYFDFKFTPQERAQLGTFVIKVFDMDEDVNELGYYAEEYCLATTENHIILPGRDSSLPDITLTALSPGIIYNSDIRYITVTGRGMEFFESDLLDKILLSGDNGKSYDVPAENIIFGQGSSPGSITIMLDEYMEVGSYQLHFIWKNTKTRALSGVSGDFTSDAMTVKVSGDSRYNNACYGVVTVQRDGKDKYRVAAYKNEEEFLSAEIDDEDLLLSFRGDIRKDKSKNNLYRLTGKGKDVNISRILNYHGDDLTIEEKDGGTVCVLMDGKITTVGANTTVRDGSAAIYLKGGTEYIVPVYNEDGEVEENGELSSGQDFIELKWDNAFDVLTTVGGFLIDMKYGVLGKIESDGETANIISFGGSLDLGFMTPGGAAAVRKNTKAGRRWTTDLEEIKYDGDDDSSSFGLMFDEESGEFKSQTKEVDVEPANEDADRVSAGAEIKDVLFGGADPGYIGINMTAHIALPQIVKFLPQKIEGELSVNTIGSYEVGVDAGVETGPIAMALSFVVKESPSGAPIPDKLYFTIGGFEPGINIDGLGIVWVTGGGGGFENLYDTIYGKDGVPPLTLLLNVEFDITKILTGSADLELSLRSVKLSFNDLSLKMLKDARFIDGGEVAIGWYPNFNLNLSGGVNFLDIMNGRLTITAAAGRGTADFVEFVLNVSIGLPKYIPIVGGMELASAELGGGSRKVWGSVEVLSLIRVGFTYYWGGSIEFTHGNPSGTETFAEISEYDAPAVMRTKKLYNEMLKPVKIGSDPETGEGKFASVGGNLSYSAGSIYAPDFDERVKAMGQNRTMTRSLANGKTEVLANGERTSHIVSFGERSDYIISVSRSDGKEISENELKNSMTVKKGTEGYALRYYERPDHGATDGEKTNALKNANVNISDKAAYIVIPESDTDGDFLISFSDGTAYDVSVIKVNRISTIKTCSSRIENGVLKVAWEGENIKDSAEVIVSATDGTKENSVILSETKLWAKDKKADIALSDKMPSGEYKITVTLSDEGVTYDDYDAGTVKIENGNAPGDIQGVTMTNFGDDKLKITVNTEETGFDGYLVEVYEDGKLADTGLWFDRDEDIIVGGSYDIASLGENAEAKVGKMGYTPGKSYIAKVRLCNVKDVSGANVYYSGAYKLSPAVTLKKSTPPTVGISYGNGEIKITSDVPVKGELYINGSTRDGEWFDLTDMKTEHKVPFDSYDGEYSLSFFAADGDNDHVMKEEVINVDRTAPVIMIASPLSGECFDSDSVTVTASAERDAEYSFTVNGKEVLPKESDIFDGDMLKCTLLLDKECAKSEIRITAKDSAGNETVKEITLINKKLSEITSIAVLSGDKEIKDGRLLLGEGESAVLKVVGTTGKGEKIDVTEMEGTTLKVAGGSAKLDGAAINAGYAGESLVSAKFDLGGNDSLSDGLVISVADKGLDYAALDSVIAEAKSITNKGYTDKSWNALKEAVAGAEKVRKADGVTQEDIDRSATIVSDAIAGLKEKSSGSSSSGGSAAYYTVSFNTNGAESISYQKIRAGLKATKPKDPEKEGYTFGGWYIDKFLKEPYDFGERVTRSFTLYAKWDKKEAESEWENPFSDVKKDDWFYDYVAYAAGSGLFNGVSESEFGPDAPLTRAMLVTVLWRNENRPVINYAMPFDDVDGDAYYSEAVRWAVGNNIVFGVAEDKFAPDENITREQIAAIIYRYMCFKGDSPKGAWAIRLSYGDVGEISDWASEAVMYLKLKGIMTGDENNAFNPKKNATRAETAVILKRLAEN